MRGGGLIVLLVASGWLATGCGTAVSTPRTPPPSEPEPLPTGGAAPDPLHAHNTIRWSTASEVDNFGFDVYRSQDEEGPFERINPEVIEGGGTSDEPRYYEYVDDTIDPTGTYFYYVESISMAGVRERFTPIGKAGPKLPRPERSE